MNQQIVSSRKTAFTAPETMPGPLSAAVAGALLAEVGDVTFIVSAEGVILDAAVSNRELVDHGFADWVGTAFVDTLTIESRSKAIEMIADAGKSGAAPRWRQVNHPASGGDIPVRYLMMALGSSERLVAIGRDMRGAAAMQQRLLQTQQSLERDYIKLRQAETRYRLLFDIASEPVLIVDAATRRIREANPAAHRLLDAPDGSLIGNPVDAIVETRDRDDFIAHLGAAEAADELAPIALHLAGRRGEARISARLFSQSRQPLLLVRIAASAAAAEQQPRGEVPLGEVVERMPDGFVLVDRDLVVLTANAAFMELAESPAIERLVGGRLDSWLGRPGIDLDLMLGQIREHGSVRNVATIVRGVSGAEEEVEVSGVSAPMGGSECFGFVIRSVGRRLRGAVAGPGEVPRSVEQLTELVGRMSLKEIVRESTDLIERLCIEAALSYTSDNRASAAEVLGVSRQSLYSKLHRHGLGNLVSGDN